MFARTARYAEDPEKYLRETLGPETFEARKHLLSIPDSIQRDLYGTGGHMHHLEQHIAQKVLGKQCGLFFITGIQAQLAALKIYCERAGKNKVAWHVSSHLEIAEENAFEALYGLERTLIGNDPEALPTVQETQEVLNRPFNERPAAIAIELPNRTLGCRTYSFQDLEKISAACQEAEVALHVDGARLWEVEPYYEATAGKSFVDLAGLFSSVYVSFYKGLQGAAGAMLVHDDESFIEEARIWKRRAGGTAVTLTYEVTDCERGYNENIGNFASRREKMIRVVDAVTAATKRYRTKDGTRIVSFSPEKATCCQIHTIFSGYTAEQLIQARDRVQENSNVRIFERPKPKMTTESNSQDSGADPKKHFIEWMIMNASEKIEDQVFVDVYVALCEELQMGYR
jgi:hypothetical protein